jgi:hypothetical protein
MSRIQQRIKDPLGTAFAHRANVARQSARFQAAFDLAVKLGTEEFQACRVGCVSTVQTAQQLGGFTEIASRAVEAALLSYPRPAAEVAKAEAVAARSCSDAEMQQLANLNVICDDVAIELRSVGIRAKVREAIRKAIVA